MGPRPDRGPHAQKNRGVFTTLHADSRHSGSNASPMDLNGHSNVHLWTPSTTSNPSLSDPASQNARHPQGQRSRPCTRRGSSCSASPLGVSATQALFSSPRLSKWSHLKGLARSRMLHAARGLGRSKTTKSPRPSPKKKHRTLSPKWRACADSDLGVPSAKPVARSEPKRCLEDETPRSFVAPFWELNDLYEMSSKIN